MLLNFDYGEAQCSISIHSILQTFPPYVLLLVLHLNSLELFV
jgi:hypothetical protein